MIFHSMHKKAEETSCRKNVLENTSYYPSVSSVNLSDQSQAFVASPNDSNFTCDSQLEAFPSAIDLWRQSRRTSLPHLSLISTFLLMYRSHCERLLDALLRCSTCKLHTYLTYFWQALPAHLHSLLSLPAFHSLVALCDCILYKSACRLYTSILLHTPTTER